MQDSQLMQASGVTMSTIEDLAPVAKILPVKGQTDHLGRDCRSTRVEPFIPTALCKQTSTCTIGSPSIHVH